MKRIVSHPCRRKHATPQGLACCALRTRDVRGQGPFAAYDHKAARNPAVILSETKGESYRIASQLGYEVCELVVS